MAKMKRHSREFWERLLDEYENRPQGVTQPMFAAQKGVNLGTMQGWLAKLRKERRALVAVETTTRFIEIEAPAAPLVRVQLGGVSVDFETLPPPAWVAELAAFGGRSC